jgi:ParB/RepB/Spo0J family partition protein
MKTDTIEPTTNPTDNFEDQGESLFIDLENLVPNPWNRGKGTAEDLAKLAESVRLKGYLQPILVRKHPDQKGKFEIVAGEQRYHAGALAGRDAIPALVRDEMTDAEVMEIMEIENLRRVAPSPMQQAELIRTYRNKGYDTRNLAAVLGESAHVIRRREKLLELSPAWKKSLADKESPFALWTAAHLELIARYTAKMQDDVLRDLRYDDPGEKTPEALEEYLRERTKALHLFPWDLGDATLTAKAGSCNACPKRTGAMTDLFGEVNGAAGSEDSCMDGDCAKKKMDAFINRKIAQLKKEHGECVKLGNTKNYGYKSQDGSLGTDEYSLLQNQKAGAVPGVFIEGDKKGSWSWCLVGKNKTSTKPSSSSGSSEKGAGPVTPLKELKERREKRLRCHVLDQVIAHVESKAITWTSKERELLITLLYTFGTDRTELYRTNPTWAKVAAVKKALTADELWTRVRPVLIEQLRGDLNNSNPDLKEAKEIAAITGFDLAAGREQAEKDIPVPASWAARAEAEKESAKAGKGKKKSKAPRAAAKSDDAGDDWDNIEEGD